MTGWHSDPTSTIDWICKFRAFVVFSTRTLAIWLITLATIDRWLLSSLNNHRRQMSNLRNAKIETIICGIFSILSYIHMPFCYQAKLQDQPLECYGGTPHCRIATDVIYALITIIIPLILMTLFGLLTISNMRQVQARIYIQHPQLRSRSHQRDAPGSTIAEHAQRRKTNRHLLRMLIVQVACLIILCLPQAIQKLHITMQPFGTGSVLNDAIKNFLYNLGILLAFLATGMPFYIYTLAGGVMFRKGFLDLIRNSSRKIKQTLFHI